MWDVDSGTQLETYNVSGAEVNALGFYRNSYGDDGTAAPWRRRLALVRFPEIEHHEVTTRFVCSPDASWCGFG